MTDGQPVPELRIETLGGLRVTINGAPIPGFISRKVDALLVYLACTRREHPRETLGELLWDDLSQERTMGNLRTALSDLQKHLAPYLNISRYSAGVTLDAPIWVDSIVLNKALDQADRVLQLNESLNAAAADGLSEALALVGGDFLRGFSIKSARGFEGWYLLEAERLRGRVIEAYGRLAEYALKKRLYKQGLDYATRTLKIDPLWEPAHRSVMKLLALSGQRSQAIAQYETCCKLLEEELALEPEDDTLALYEQIIAGELAPQAETPSAVAPTFTLPDTPFVPRPSLQARIDGLLNRPDCRLIALVGPGGSGKTRLAIDAAARHAANFPDGIAFVPLERATETEEAIAAIVSALQIGTRDHSLERRLIEHLYGREILLVLDTVEQVKGISAFIERLLIVARSLRILVTSQERLNIKTEYAVSISGMDVPAADAANAESYPSIALFSQHAERITGDFDMTAHLPDVIALCAFVSGNPLAIELAAAWSRLMTPAQILSEIRRSGDFLTSTAQDAPDRHRSMRAVFDWTWARFSAADRELASKMAVFSGDFSPEAATAIAGASAVTLTALADRSLVMVSGGRCRVHGLLRGFLVEKLEMDAEAASKAHSTHAVFFAMWASKLIPSLIKHTDNDSVALVIREADNLSSAWRYAVASRNADWLEPLAEVYFYFHRAMNRYAEGAALMQEALEALGEAKQRVFARISTFSGVLQMSLAHYEQAMVALRAGIAELTVNDDANLLRIAHDAMGATAYATGDYDAARAGFEAALEVARMIDDRRAAANSLFRLGDIQAVHGDYAGAQGLLEDGLSLGDDAASPHDRVRYLNLLADVACKVGDYEAAHQYAEEALSAATVIGSRVQRGVALATLGRADYGRGLYKESRDFLRRSVAQAEEIENRWGKAFGQAYLARTCWHLNELAAARFHLEQAQAVAQDIQSAWLMALIQRLRALPAIERSGSPIQMLGMAVALARSIRAIPLALDALAGLATALLDAGAQEEAALFARCAASDSVSEADTRAAAESVLAVLPASESGTAINRNAVFDRAVVISASFVPNIA
ncbi:MAG: tetratricopeptide repeat protein [Chloroflexi bacterium]|nr:tetratricopeptide repeat protein [Chloroflexota bacterium]